MIVYKKNKNFALRSESATAVLALGSTESVGFVLERSRFQLDFRPNTFVIIMIDLSNDPKVNINMSSEIDINFNQFNLFCRKTEPKR